MNDLMFDLAKEKSNVDIGFVAKKTGLAFSGLKKALVDPPLRRRLNQDIKDAIEYGIVGTPGFVIGGEVHIAQIPSEILKKILD
jgi:predicted DsbA family dithiol-disulfide isomerase